MLFISMNFLNPFKINNWNNPNQKIYKFCSVNWSIFNASMKPLIKQKITLSSYLLPLCEFTRASSKRNALFICVNIVTSFTVTVFTIIFKGFFYKIKMISLGAKMTKMFISYLVFLFHGSCHLLSIVFMEAVPFYHNWFCPHSFKNMVERIFNCRCACS